MTRTHYRRHNAHGIPMPPTPVPAAGLRFHRENAGNGTLWEAVLDGEVIGRWDTRGRTCWVLRAVDGRGAIHLYIRDWRIACRGEAAARAEYAALAARA